MMHAVFTDYAPQDQAFFYESGICLAAQSKIVDWQSLKQVTSVMYHDIQEIQQIVDLFLMMNGTIIEEGVTGADQLMNVISEQITEHQEYLYIELDFIALAAACQELFCVYLEVCPCQPSLVAFKNCLDSNDTSISIDSKKRLVQSYDDFTIRFNKFQITVQEIF
ncbi:hypothetical protein C0J27_02995 [Candidatus Chromulinivorax destructor]|uniref:Uncharacterized protein n=2 Tax=Candidatus Chromulinivorax destructor TaxID=2066483 RepID=A0A345ZBN0_9BACT|nr:hypothetical protein C0J27_02995 [Candidatus Chromulinivorax destructor]